MTGVVPRSEPQASEGGGSRSDRERKALGRRWLPGIASLFVATLSAFGVL